jgi:hypothetical protein
MDQRAQLEPKIQSWTRSRLPWIDAIPTLPSLDGDR